MVKGSYLWEAISGLGHSSEPHSRLHKSAVVFLFSCLVFGIAIAGIWCLGRAYKDTAKNLSAVTWPKASGRITEATVQEVRSGAEGSDTTFSPSITVRYEVNGKWYSCQSLFAGYGSTSDSCKAYGDVAGLVAGDKTTVYYNPSDPSDSMLRPGKHGVNFLFLIVGGVLMCISAVLGAPLLFSRSKEPTVQPASGRVG